MTDQQLANHFKGWSNEALQSWRSEIIRMDLSKVEVGWIDQELERRRKEAEEVA